MKKRQLYDKKTGKNFVPISHTKAVLTPTGETAEARNTRQQQAVQGTGVSASANRYPFMSLGDVTSIADVNRLLDTAYTSTDTKYQGRLRLRRSGQVAWVDQVLMNSLLGNWVQVLYGCYAPSSTGNSVVVDGKYHILWRQRTGTTSMPWRDLTSQMTLKTINGQSIAGCGNIQISGAEQITIDQELDADSENAIANKVVTEVLGGLRSSINFILNRDSNIIPVTIWADSIDEDTYEDGIWWYKPTENKLYRNEDGTWDDHGTVSEGTILVKLSENSFYHKNATGMKEVYGDEMKTLQTKVPTFYHVENTITNNRYTPESGTYEGNGGYVIIDKQTPRPVLVVSENSTLKYYLNWTSTNNGERLLPSEYSFTPLDFYIYHPHIEDSTEIVIGYYDGVWESTDHYDMTGNIAEMYDVAYDEDDCDQESNFPAGDDSHQYAIYNVLLYHWDEDQWVEVTRQDPDIPFLIKCKNKIWKVWSDEKTVVFDFSPDNALDETSKNAVQNKVVAARINEHTERLDAIETALPSVRGCKVLPIDGVMPAGYSYLIEDVGYAGEGGELLLDVTNQRVVLALTEDGGEEIATIYFAVWNDAGGRLPYDVYNLTDPTNIIFAWDGEGALHFGKLSGETLVEIAAGSAPTINIDNVLNRNSSNPVTNSAITNAINGLVDSANDINQRTANIESSNSLFGQPLLPFNGLVYDTIQYLVPGQSYNGEGGEILVDEGGRRILLRALVGGVARFYDTWSNAGGRVPSRAYNLGNVFLWKINSNRLNIYKWTGRKLVDIGSNAITNLETRVAAIENTSTKMVYTIRVWGDDETVCENWVAGDLWWNDGDLKVCTAGGLTPTFEDTTPIEGVMYYAVETKKWYIWDGNEFDELLRASSQS